KSILAGGTIVLQARLASGLRGRENTRRQLVRKLRPEVLQLSLVGIDLGGSHRRLNLGYQVALVRAIADFHVERFQLARDLGADIDRVERLQIADGRDKIFD